MREWFKPTDFDFFILFDFGLLLLMAAFVYYKGEAEFFLYAVVFIVVGLSLWWWLRRYGIPWPVLALLQVGILAHFAGGLVHIDGVRLYGHVFFGVRFDKYVHLYNSFAGVLALNHVFNNNPAGRRRMSEGRLVGLVFGIGVAVELVELTAYVALPKTGVGTVRNNASDLAANLLGGLLAVSAIRARGRRLGRGADLAHVDSPSSLR